MSQKKGERGRGHVYLQHDAWYLQFYQTENRDGVLVRVRKSVKLADKDREHNSATCKAVKALRDAELARIGKAPVVTAEDMRVVDFWEHHYVPYCAEIIPKTGRPRKRPSTMKGYKQVWNQHLKDHFGAITLQKYQPHMGTKFLDSVTATQGMNTLKHIRAVGSSIFRRAVQKQLITMNPWHGVVMPDDVIEPEDTEHYTMEEAENLISALVDHVDAQLVLALACFLGLMPAEIAGLQWGDIDADWIHIRRNKPLHGEVGPPKTKERAASLPIIDQVRVPLELWRARCPNTDTKAWVIADLPNMLNRIIKPHILGEKNKAKIKTCVLCDTVPKASGVAWKGLYAGRRGAITAVVERNNGNLHVGQALARHKHMTTTAQFYKKQADKLALREAMIVVQQSLKGDK
jgi:integrase